VPFCLWAAAKNKLNDEKNFIISIRLRSFISNWLILWKWSKSQIRTPLRRLFYWNVWSESWWYFDHLISFLCGYVERYGARSNFLKIQNVIASSSGFQKCSYREIELMASKMLSTWWRFKFRAEQWIITSPSDDRFSVICNWQLRSDPNGPLVENLTLKNFEPEVWQENYRLIGENYKRKNLWQKYMKLGKTEWSLYRDHASVWLKSQMCFLAFGLTTNPAVAVPPKKPCRYRSNRRTNWQKYLPPRFFKTRWFSFRSFGQKAKKKEWGKGWVAKRFLGKIESWKIPYSLIGEIFQPAKSLRNY